MARPAFVDITHGQESWDAVVNNNMAKIGSAPAPIYRAATVAVLAALAPGSYENCLAMTEDTDEVWHSDGSAWRLVGGDLGHVDAAGARGAVKKSTQLLSAMSGASVVTTGLIPAGVDLHGVSLRVVTLITGATTFDAGDGTDVDRFGAAIALAAGTTKTPADATADPTGWLAAAREVTLTANGAPFSAGAVRVCALYAQLTAPTSNA